MHPRLHYAILSQRRWRKEKGTEHVSGMLCVEVRWEGGSLQSALEFKGGMNSLKSDNVVKAMY